MQLSINKYRIAVLNSFTRGDRQGQSLASFKFQPGSVVNELGGKENKKPFHFKTFWFLESLKAAAVF